MIGPRSTVEAARHWLRQRLHDGADCPVCTQHVQLYRRKLNSGMAKALIQIWSHAGQEWTRVQDIPDGPRGGDYAKLRFWGLLESSAERSDDGNSAGFWRVTDLGKDFIFNRTLVPSHIGTFNNRVYPLKGAVEHVSIRTALGDKFNYDELINGQEA